MQIRTSIVLVALTICFVTSTTAQHGKVEIKNGLAVGGGVTLFDIQTDNFNTESKLGWMVAASATADLPHKWYNISYSIQIAENKMAIEGSQFAGDAASSKQIDFKIFTAQVGLLWHIKLAGPLLTLDLGPQLQYNGKLELQSDNSDNIYVHLTDGPSLLAEDIEDISQFNINGAAGLTLAFGAIKVRGQYMYGFLNTFNKLNDQNLENEEELKGNMSMFAFTAVFTF